MSLIQHDVGENHIGEFGISHAIVTPTLAVTAAAYSAGNCVGGLLTLTGAMRKIGGAGELVSLELVDHANQKAPIDLLIFESQPAASFTDKAAMPTLAIADARLLLARVSLLATDYATVGGLAIASLGALRKLVAATTSADLKAVMSTTGTPTYAATTDLVLRLGFRRG